MKIFLKVIKAYADWIIYNNFRIEFNIKVKILTQSKCNKYYNLFKYLNKFLSSKCFETNYIEYNTFTDKLIKN